MPTINWAASNICVNQFRTAFITSHISKQRSLIDLHSNLILNVTYVEDQTTAYLQS
jgi:hypothetical protein